MANLSYKNDEQADERLNPATVARNLQAAEESNGNSPTSDTTNLSVNSKNNSIADTAEQEKNPDQIPYTSGGDQKSKSNSITLRGRIKKAGPFGVIGGIILSGFFGLSLLSPGLLLVQLKETMADKFNDQLATMDVRSTKLLKKKLGTTTTKGICNPVSIRCKYRTIGERQLKKLEKAGFTVNGDRTSITGRMKPTSFVFDGRSISASQLLTEAAKDSDLRSALRKGYNPKFAAFSDAIAAKVRAKLGLKKSRNIDPSIDEEKMKTQLTENTSGKSIADLDPPKAITDKDGNVTGYEDSNGVKITEEEFNKYGSISAELETRSSLSGIAKKAAVKSGLKGVLTSTAFGLGSIDTICTGWTILRVASFASKIFGARQLIRYSYQFMNIADEIKAGDASPEEVSFLNNILTAPNSEGKTATDSNGYKYAAYGDAFSVGNFDTDNDGKSLTDDAVNKNEIANETAKYVNGQIIPDNIFASFISTINSIGGGSGTKESVDKFCKFEKSWTVQGILIGVSILGAVAAIFSGGGSISAGAIAQAGAMATLSVALGLLTPKLVDLAKGTLITGDENGNEAGNAITSGMGAYNAQSSQARGLGVLKKDDAVAYTNTSREIAATYSEDEANELNPLDTTSNDTFLGRIVSSLLPYATKASSVSGALTSSQSLVSSSLSTIVNATSHAAPAKTSDFTSCSDSEYTSRDLAADPFCNLRYGMSEEALAIDPEVVLDYMIRGGYIDNEVNGIPQGAYAEYITECIDRSTSIGDISEGSNGDECIEGGDNNDRNTMFRLFYIDTSVNAGMDAEESIAGPTNLNVMTYNVRKDELTDSSKRNGPIAGIIKERQPAIIGFQEMQQVQATAISNALPEYSYTSAGLGGTRRIFWKTNMFSKIDGGTWHSTKNAGSDTMPWVKLQTTNGKILYVFDVHTEPGSQPGAAASQAADAKHLLEDVIPKATGNDGNPIIVTGDMNSGYPGHAGDGTTSFYTNFTKNNTYALTFNSALTKKNDDCSTGHDFGEQRCGIKNARHIDHIYVSTASSAVVNSWENIADNVTSTASDHNPVIVNISIPGLTQENTDSSTSTGSNIQGDDYKKECVPGYKGVSYINCRGQCVDFVLFRLAKHGIKYNAGYANGKDLAGKLGTMGYTVNSKPSVNSVMSTSATSQPQFGHTAMVSAVNSDGSIVVEEYNFTNTTAYGKRTISAAEIKAKNMIFAHTEVGYK